MRNAEHIKFMFDVKGKVDIIGAAILGVQRLYDKWATALINEEKTIEVEQGFAVTAEIQSADKLRDHDHYSLRLFVESEQYGRDPQRKEAAGRIMRIIKQVGNPTDLPLQEETAVIFNLLNQLENNYGADIAAIGLQQKVAYLKESNTAFDKLYNDRTNEAAARASGNTRAARQTVDPLYRQLMSGIESLSAINDHVQPWADCIMLINQVIADAKNKLARREGGRKDEEKEKKENQK